MNRIIEDNIFEEYKLFDDNSSIHLAASKKIENIFRRLFKNTEVDSNNFYFTVFEDDSPNAWFLHKKYTKQKNKNIIAVSRGMIDTCKNEAELAGIIGHECGHYLWDELLKGNNSIFQEHAADLRAIDLLINGGYNPRHHIEICKRFLGNYGRERYHDINIDVHGNSLARIDDMKDYMTKIANEKGDFPLLNEEDDKDYINFRENIKNIYEKEGYDTYIEKCLKRDFGTKDIEKIDVQNILNMLLNEVKQGNISPEKTVRFNEMFRIIKHLPKKTFQDKSPELTELCKNFFMETHNLIANTDFSNINIKDYERDCYYKNINMLESFKLEKFGDFAKQKENIEHFVNYKNIDDAIYWANEMYKLSWTSRYAHCFTDGEYPAFTPNKENNNIGKMFPWDELNNFNKERQSKELKWAVTSLHREMLDDICYSNPDYKPEDYFLDENKIVLAYGDEARIMREKEQLEQNTQDFLSESDICFQRFKTNIDFLNTLAEFDRSDDIQKKKKLANEIAYLLFEDKRNKKDINIDNGLTYFSSRAELSSICLNNPYINKEIPHIDEMKKMYETSAMRMHFISQHDEISRNLAKNCLEEKKNDTLKNFNPLNTDVQKYYDDLYFIETLSSETSITSNTHLHQSICYSLLRVGNFLQQHDKHHAELVFDKLYDNFISKTFHHKIDYLHLYERFSDELDYFNRYERFNPRRDYSSRENPIRKRLATDYDANVSDLQENYYRYSMLNSGIINQLAHTHGRSYSTLDILVMSEFNSGQLKFSSKLDRAMKTMGFNPECDFDENLKILDDVIGKDIKIWETYDRNKGDIYKDIKLENSLYDESNDIYKSVKLHHKAGDTISFVENAGFLMLAYTIKKGKNYDLKNSMKYLHHSRSSSYYAPVITDILALSIQKDNKFSKMSLEDKIYVYEVMDEKNLFSEKYANKIEFFREIVNDIVNENDKEKAAKYAELLLSRQYVGKNLEFNDNRKNNDIEFHKEKDILIDFYAKSKSDKLGIDDGSDVFYNKAIIVADELLLSIKDKYGREIDKFPRDTLHAILDKISTNVVSQELTAQMLDEKGKFRVSGNDAEKYDYHARLMLAAVAALAKNPDNAKTVIDFLSTKCTDESINKVFEKIPETYDLRRGKQILIDSDIELSYNTKLTFDKSTLVMLHENFWHANLPARAYVMKRILNAYTSHENTDEDKKNKKLDLVVDMFFDKKSQYYKDAEKIVHAIYDNLQDYEQDLILGALVSANQKDKDSDKKLGGEAIGEGLKMFFENKGPAFVKFGQMLSYLPSLDSEIRKPLAKLRDKADIPSRAKLFTLLKETIPNEELAKISRVDKVLGAGSFFITAKINYEGKDCVVSVMRPYAKELSKSGMDMINNTIECLVKQDSKYETLRNIAYQAKISAESETDIDADYYKYEKAIKIYDDIKIETPAGEFAPNVQKWKSYGAGKEGQVYKIMDMASGLALTSDKMDEKQKHDMAVAYVTLELCNLLSGARWDTDRHQGQQNFHEDGFKKFIIGIFDTGAQIQHDPSKKDKIILGELLYGMVRAARVGKNVADYMIDKVQKIDKIGNRLNINTLYIDEVQRGLTALSDIITYQKEKKDEKGNIIQEEKSLTSKEIGQIANAILESGLVDKHVMKTIKAKAILNKLRPLRKGWISSLNEGIKKISSTIKITKRTDEDIKSDDISRKDKPQDEIDCVINEKNARRKLGVNIENIQGYSCADQRKGNHAVAALKQKVKVKAKAN